MKLPTLWLTLPSKSAIIETWHCKSADGLHWEKNLINPELSCIVQHAGHDVWRIQDKLQMHWKNVCKNLLGESNA